ncbi:MAG TPA: PA14 domain-containing protein, partial [Candidatus Dormibacteraeota bacterium]|nr:PA14 domain-containing protein [Candidatus Dormibacteraeota bacterium]
MTTDQNTLTVEMLPDWTNRGRTWPLVLSILLWFGKAALAQSITNNTPPPAAITNLQQLTTAVVSERSTYRDLRLEFTVCAASKPELGILVVQDDSGVEWLQLGNLGREILPGERVQIRWWHCLLRKRDAGIEICPGPVVDNDGLHMRRTWVGGINLKAGRNPFRLDWFNCLRDMNLEFSCLLSNKPLENFGASNLWHEVVDKSSGQTNLLPGLQAECFEGYWESVPDFELLQPVKTGVTTNFDLGFRTRDEMVGIRFTGYLDVPQDGTYTFRVRSDDGSLLFVGAQTLAANHIVFTKAPKPSFSFPGQLISSPLERRWTTIEGRVNFVSKKGRGLEFELRSDENNVSVRIADASALEFSTLSDSKLRITGIAQPVLTSDKRLVLGRLFAIDSQDVSIVEPASPTGKPDALLTSVAQVHGLRIEDARRGLPVRIRGVVTDSRNSAYEKWISLQDETRGIFVHLTGITNALPAFGQSWEVLGHSAAGDFAPVVNADQALYQADGRLPEPVRPTWRELVNGSLDVQWAELQGLVTDVSSNVLTLLLPQGAVDVQMNGYYENELKPFQKTIARIRGVLYAVWNADTREVRVGTVLMRNARISVDTPAPADPFDAPPKAPRELFLFDPHASAFQRVKVRAQVLCFDGKRAFASDAGSGLRILPAEVSLLAPGDLIEAVGYPEISGPSPLLREAFVRKTGSASLPAPRNVNPADLLEQGLDATRLRLEAKLVGFHSEQENRVLELQSGNRLFFARLPVPKAQDLFEVGSRLALTGVYAAQDVSRKPAGQIDSFELLLNSPTDITVLSQPPWWTLQRMLSVVGALLVVLALAAS